MEKKEVEFLLVDDDRIVLMLHEASLIRNKVTSEPKSFLNGPEALAYIREQYPKGKHFVILLDIYMPEMDGWEFIETLRDEDMIERSHIIIVTSSVDIPDRLKVEEYPEVIHMVIKALKKQDVEEIRKHPKLAPLLH
ncbi:Response regulator receiver domain-containing protein [Cyclonatronum proteinivorum]|uniref:Response regulator receiver domain-containing protein n=1 Tax=Cyclonatronum proteinivorum TaxID=1457365 RepID=A0A345UHD3_9BACT|nr:response regulator [Cyclonatronum proteinivorum]AXI99884.1 Response regulator receiver domain-containing protein [Cyclonatronum proteinivorum]